MKKGERPMARSETISRRTKETDITLTLNLDGHGKCDVSTGVGFFDHMLTHLARHSGWDVTVSAKGDLQVDFHHTVEDIGICLGQALKKALGDKAGIERFADSAVPMDEALAHVAVDISGRAHLTYAVEFPTDKTGTFDVELIEEFLQAFVNHAAITLHVTATSGTNSHHIAEAIFKALARAMGRATRIGSAGGEIPSTKGTL